MTNDWLKTMWPRTSEDCDRGNILIADEAGLFFKALPDIKEKNVKGTCVIVLVCADRITGNPNVISSYQK